MKRLYWNDTYLMTHRATVTAIDKDEHGHFLRLDETIFHPQGGGQPSDEGTINGMKVVKLKDMRDINEINHYLENVESFKIGDIVDLVIDREKRLEYASLHTAGHITAGILRVNHHYKNQTSANHFPNQAKVEFLLQNNVQKETLEKEAHDIINQARVIKEELNADGLRCISIDNLWTEPCSGTHVSDTSQIEHYLIRKIETKKGKLTVGYAAQFKSQEN